MPNIHLFDHDGNRKYLTLSERERFEKAALEADGITGSFCLMMLYTGCRISEALNLKLLHLDDAAQSVTFQTLKQRQSGIFRQVPLPEHYLNMLNQVHDFRRRLDKPKERHQFIWNMLWKGNTKPWSRKTGYSRVMQLMEVAQLEGIAATPKGLRHGFAIACIEKHIPLNMVQKWMGHSSITTTAIYANATGEQERKLAARLWT